MPFLILGVDPGLLRTGFGVIDYSNNSPKYLSSGVLKTKSSDPTSVRLACLFNGLKEILERYQINAITLEETFVNKNPATSLTLGYARSVILTLAGIFNIEVFEYAPNHVKKTITGNGHAEKEQVQYMVKKLLSIDQEIKYYDESDALAIALTYQKLFMF